MHFRKRLIPAVCMLGIICIAFLTRNVRAEEIDGSFTYTTSGIEGEEQEKLMEFHYRDSFFTAPSYDLNMDMMAMSVRIAMAGFGIGDDSQPEHLLPLFDQLGIRYSEKTVHYGPSTADSIGFAYGERIISDEESVIVAVVRGGNYGDEWASNFTIGTGEEHIGFKMAATVVAAELRDYVLALPKERRVSVWITGYSRGAAVTNMAAAELDDISVNGGLGNVRPENIYAFCFECPFTTGKEFTAEEKNRYSNIFSVVNEFDAVTKVVPGRWGFERYGITLVLPSPINCKEYKRLAPVMEEKLKLYADIGSYNIQPGQAVYLDHAVEKVSGFVGTQKDYVKYVQETVRDMILGQEGFLLNKITELVMPYIRKYIDNLREKPKKDSIMNYGLAHAPELCMAWIDTIPDGRILLDCERAYQYIVFDGAADVYVYDTKGTLLWQGDGKNLRSFEENNTGSVYGITGEFLFAAPRGSEYILVFNADKRNKIDLSVRIFDRINSKDIFRADYRKEKLKKKQTAVLVLREEHPTVYVCEDTETAAILAALTKGEIPQSAAVIGPDSEKRTEEEHYPMIWIAEEKLPKQEPEGNGAGETEKNGGSSRKSRYMVPLISLLAVVILSSVVVLCILRKKRKEAENKNFEENREN